MKKNKFIVVEGIEGSGKTTACKKIKKFLILKKIKKVIILRQPGSTLISEKIRSIIKYKNKNEKLNLYSELFLLYSARLQLLENIIKPELKKGSWIICDRHNLSSISYQGGGRGININIIKNLSKITDKIAKPDLTIFFDVKPKIGIKRILLRSKLDRIEKESLFFFSKVRKFYLKYLSLISEKIIIDANHKLKKVFKLTKKKLYNWLKKFK
ncbi:MAG: dTMP kinase [Buchnera aphidicola (Periphyllus lyropictus)]|uniref:dTMP kinase n=1 Tax=Buchnera aphidicola TaxID=9 RepID=UPI001EB15741|nr:dTMP kinase [Buchnera aphidicola]NIH16591.1 dTMP kinase [Buchnera aphidicola (Periphyllus lyropictus)]USS94481.1 dTMP kinase [Buchnera aphidicola (Periphyllus lyropictus)]